jgi:hypothetical protein
MTDDDGIRLLLWDLRQEKMKIWHACMIDVHDGDDDLLSRKRLPGE